MPAVVITLFKTLGVFFVKKMLLDLALDLVEESLAKGAAKTEYKWDDNLVKSFSENKADIKKIVQGVL